MHFVFFVLFLFPEEKIKDQRQLQQTRRNPEIAHIFQHSTIVFQTVKNKNQTEADKYYGTHHKSCFLKFIHQFIPFSIKISQPCQRSFRSVHNADLRTFGYFPGLVLFISSLAFFLKTIIMPPLMIKTPPSKEPGVIASCKKSAAIIVAARGST
jgi:hypothetical protein